jgi:hypothetical protein
MRKFCARLNLEMTIITTIGKNLPLMMGSSQIKFLKQEV